jgi:hypothetical protein
LFHHAVREDTRELYLQELRIAREQNDRIQQNSAQSALGFLTLIKYCATVLLQDLPMVTLVLPTTRLAAHQVFATNEGKAWMELQQTFVCAKEVLYMMKLKGEFHEGRGISDEDLAAFNVIPNGLLPHLQELKATSGAKVASRVSSKMHEANLCVYAQAMQVHYEQV